MSKSINRVQVLGYLGKDPEVKYLESGKVMALLSLSTSEVWVDKKNNERKELTEWHNIVFYVGGEVLEKYCRKGSRLLVDGKLQTRKYQAQDGSTRYSTQIVGREFTLLDSRESGASDKGERLGGGDGNMDDVPF